MTIESDIYTHLQSTSALTNLVGTRITPIYYEANTALPAIMYRRESNGADVDMDSLVKDNPRFRFFLLDNSYLGVRALAEVLKTAMIGASTFKAIFINDYDLNFDNDQQQFEVAVDFSIW